MSHLSIQILHAGLSAFSAMAAHDTIGKRCKTIVALLVDSKVMEQAMQDINLIMKRS